MPYFNNAGEYYEGDFYEGVACPQRPNVFAQWSSEAWIERPTVNHDWDAETKAFVFNSARALASIRTERDSKLVSSDFTQLPDSPFTVEKKAEWVVYRQALRDFPETCNPENPVWPTVPA